MTSPRAGNGDLTPPGGSEAPTSESPLDRIPDATSVAEQIATLVEWAREIEHQLLSAIQLRDQQYSTALLTAAESRNALHEAIVAVSMSLDSKSGHLADGLRTLTDEVQRLGRLIASLDAGRAQVLTAIADLGAEMREGFRQHRLEHADADGALARELGARAQHDSRHDEAIEEHHEEITATRRAVAATRVEVVRVQRKLTALQALKLAGGAGGLGVVFELGKALLKLALAALGADH